MHSSLYRETTCSRPRLFMQAHALLANHSRCGYIPSGGDGPIIIFRAISGDQNHQYQRVHFKLTHYEIRNKFVDGDSLVAAYHVPDEHADGSEHANGENCEEPRVSAACDWPTGIGRPIERGTPLITT